jgi:hypothetical protein
MEKMLGTLFAPPQLSQKNRALATLAKARFVTGFPETD